MKRMITIILCFILCLGIGVTAGVFGYKYFDNIKAAFGFKTEIPDKENDKDKPNIEDTKDKIKVTFKYDDKETIVYVVPNGYAHIDVPVKDGYEFAGWYLKYEPENEYDDGYEFVYLDLYHITEETTFYAQYIKIHTVTFKYENEDKTFEIFEESTVDLDEIEEPSKAGQDFLGWHIQGEEQGYVTDLEYYSIVDDVVFEPVFAPSQEELPYIFEGNKITKYLGDEEGTLNIPSSYANGRQELNKYIFNVEHDVENFIYQDHSRLERMLPLTLTDKNGQTFEINDTYSYRQWLDNVEFPASIKVTKETFIAGSDNQITEIGESAFTSCKFSEVTMPNTITNIETAAFMYCYNLTQIQLSNTLQTLGCSVFGSCPLTTLTLPESLTTAEGALIGMTAPELRIEGPVFNIDHTDAYSLISTTIYVKAEYYYDFLDDEIWSQLAENIQYVGQLKYLPYKISGNVIIEYIGDEDEIIVPSSYSISKTISREKVFYDDYSLYCFVYGSGYKRSQIALPFSIDGQEFNDVEEFESQYESFSYPVTLRYDEYRCEPGSDYQIDCIYNQAFANTKCRKIVLPKEILNLGSSVFEYSQVEEIILPNAAISTFGYTFRYCEKLRKISLGEVSQDTRYNDSGLQFSYGDFEGCYLLEHVAFASQREGYGSVRLEEDIFKDCHYLQTVYFSSYVALSSRLLENYNENLQLYFEVESSEDLRLSSGENWKENINEDNIHWNCSYEDYESAIA